MAEHLELRIVRKIAEVPRDRWDDLPATARHFYAGIGLTASSRPAASPKKPDGCRIIWSLSGGKNIIAACPMYLKLHSMGEFVFDWEWAEAAQRAGIQYYPKMLVGVPFTPVTGHRFLTAAGQDRRQLIQYLGQALGKIAADNKISSVHVNFCVADEREALEEVGFIPRSGIQYHWQNHNFSSFDDYLGKLSQRAAQQGQARAARSGPTRDRHSGI